MSASHSVFKYVPRVESSLERYAVFLSFTYHKAYSDHDSSQAHRIPRQSNNGLRDGLMPRKCRVSGVGEPGSEEFGISRVG